MPDATQIHVQQSRDFFAKARRYLEEDDLHQASEKGWGAAAHMAKAVAMAQGLSYERHDEFFKVMYEAQRLTGEPRLRAWGNTASALHGFFYLTKDLLDHDAISGNLDDVNSLLDALETLVATT